MTNPIIELGLKVSLTVLVFLLMLTSLSLFVKKLEPYTVKLIKAFGILGVPLVFTLIMLIIWHQ